MKRDELRSLAEKATPGPWWIDSHGHAMVSTETHDVVFEHRADTNPAIRHEETGNLSHWRNDWDASYIATANPAAILELLDTVDELVGALEKAEKDLRYMPKALGCEYTSLRYVRNALAKAKGE